MNKRSDRRRLDWYTTIFRAILVGFHFLKGVVCVGLGGRWQKKAFQFKDVKRDCEHSLKCWPCQLWWWNFLIRLTMSKTRSWLFYQWNQALANAAHRVIDYRHAVIIWLQVVQHSDDLLVWWPTSAGLMVCGVLIKTSLLNFFLLTQLYGAPLKAKKTPASTVFWWYPIAVQVMLRVDCMTVLCLVRYLQRIQKSELVTHVQCCCG